MTMLYAAGAVVLLLGMAGVGLWRLGDRSGYHRRDAEWLRLIEKAQNETRNDEQDYDAAGGLGAGVVGVPDERPDI